MSALGYFFNEVIITVIHLIFFKFIQSIFLLQNLWSANLVSKLKWSILSKWGSYHSHSAIPEYCVQANKSK